MFNHSFNAPKNHVTLTLMRLLFKCHDVWLIRPFCFGDSIGFDIRLRITFSAGLHIRFYNLFRLILWFKIRFSIYVRFSSKFSISFKIRGMFHILIHFRNRFTFGIYLYCTISLHFYIGFWLSVTLSHFFSSRSLHLICLHFSASIYITQHLYTSSHAYLYIFVVCYS